MSENIAASAADSVLHFRRLVECDHRTEECNIFLRMVEDAPIGIYLVQDGQIVFGNRWMREFSGYELVDLPIPALAVITPADRPMVGQQMMLRLQGGPADPSYQVRFMKKDGSVTWTQLIARKVEWGGAPAIQGSIVDISDRVAAAERLQEYAVRLEAANRTKALLSEILTHDVLNKYWVAESRLIHLLADDAVTAGQQKEIAAIRSCLFRAELVLKEASTHLLLEDMTELEVKLIDSGQVLESVVKDLEPLLAEKETTVQADTDLPPVTASPLLREVFANLIGNAVKYSPAGTTVMVSVERGDAVRIRVSDRGPGIADEDKEDIFGCWRRPGMKSVKGLGLGLALVSRIVELHGGRVWVEDNPGGGSVFVVELPQPPAPSR